MKNCTLLVEAIRIGERARRDTGDLKPLMDSLSVVGLLHPIVVSPDYLLISGYRRLQAVKALGWAEVPVTVAEWISDAVSALKAERDENTCRLDFRPTEAIALGMRIEEIERRNAKKRQDRTSAKNTETGRFSTGGKLPQVDSGKTRYKVGEAISLSGKTYEHGKAVLKAAQEEPEKYGTLPIIMDRRGIGSAYRALRQSQHIEKYGHLSKEDTPPGDYRDAVKQLIADMRWVLVRNPLALEVLRDGRAELSPEDMPVIEAYEALITVVRAPKKPRLEVVR
jgi:hypothetical protein